MANRRLRLAVNCCLTLQEKASHEQETGNFAKDFSGDDRVPIRCALDPGLLLLPGRDAKLNQSGASFTSR